MCRSRSGGIKTINMDRLGAHNAASAILNSQFIGIEIYFLSLPYA